MVMVGWHFLIYVSIKFLPKGIVLEELLIKMWFKLVHERRYICTLRPGVLERLAGRFQSSKGIFWPGYGTLYTMDPGITLMSDFMMLHPNDAESIIKRHNEAHLTTTYYRVAPISIGHYTPEEASIFLFLVS